MNVWMYNYYGLNRVHSYKRRNSLSWYYPLTKFYGCLSCCVLQKHNGHSACLHVRGLMRRAYFSTRFILHGIDGRVMLHCVSVCLKPSISLLKFYYSPFTRSFYDRWFGQSQPSCVFNGRHLAVTGGSLGSYIDEERSKMRELMWIAEPHWTSISRTHIAAMGSPVAMFVWGSAFNLSSHSMKSEMDCNISEKLYY